MQKEKKWMRRWLSLVLVLAMLLGDVRGILPVYADGEDPSEPVVTEEATEPTTTEPETTAPETTEPETSEPVETETTEPGTEETTSPDGSVNPENGTETDPSEPDSGDGAETETEIVYTVDLTQFWAGVETLKEIFGAMEQPEAERVVQLLEQLREMVTACFTKVVEKPVVTEQPAGEAEMENESGEGASDGEAVPENTAGETTATEEPVEVEAPVEETTAGDNLDDDFLLDGGFGVDAGDNMAPNIPDAQLQPIVANLMELTALIFGTGEAEEDEEKSEVEQYGLFELLNEDDQLAVEEFFSLAAELLGYRPEAQTDLEYFNLPAGAYGSGSYNLNENDVHHRFFLEYMVDSKTSAGVKRQNTFKVLVKAGEYLCFGSSIKGSSYLDSQKEILLTVNGVTTGYDNDNTDGTGYIKTRQQERNGPRLTKEQVEGKDSTRYKPHIYHNNTNQDQEVTLVFYSKSRTVSLGTYILASEEFETKQGESTIAAWDITVVGQKEGSPTEYEVKPGRAWSKYLALTTNGNAVARGDMEVHVLTDDNYVYKVNLNQISPFGFIFFANNMGFTHSGNGYDQSIYHSFATNDVNLSSMTTQGINVHNPANQDTEHQKTYNIFFNKPSQEVRQYLHYQSRTIAAIRSINFNGVSDGVTNYKHGGDFTFNVSGATSVELILDFSEILKAMAQNEDDTTRQKADSVTKYLERYEIKNSQGQPVLDANSQKTYKAGMGIVELNSTVKDGPNTIYWDGKDVHGNYLPVGYYAVRDAAATTRINITVHAKGGEIHFPMTDVEGLYGGIQIQRLDAAPGDTHAYDIYYNNTPLSQYTYEASSRKGSAVSITNPKNSYGAKFYPITNHTYTYNAPNSSYFNIGGRITTLSEDGYTHTPVVSSDPMSGMLFRASGNDGGGNNSGIDVWTYYSPVQQVECTLTTGFAIMEHAATGEISGDIFYDVPDVDGKPNGQKDNGESGISGLRVRLVDANGDPILHTVPLPIFDEYGDFMWDEEGNILEEEREIEFTAVTDVQGRYTLNGVYYGDSETDEHTYYVQVELNEAQRKTLRYVCTTAHQVPQMVTGWDYLIGNDCGGDGNSLVIPATGTKISLQDVGYTDYKKDHDDGEYYPEFNKDFAAPITVSQKNKDNTDCKYKTTAKTIGYTSAIPKENQESYVVKKVWENANGSSAQPSVHEVVVELYVADSTTKPSKQDGQGLNNRTGRLLETVILDGGNDWSYTWPVLDNSQKYYFVEYYYMIKEKHHIHGIEEGEWEDERDHQILIGATDVLYSSNNAEGWTTGKPYFGDTPSASTAAAQWHTDETDKPITVDGKEVYEKETTIDTDCLTFKMTYALDKDGKANTVTLKNVQTYDERAYYIWAGKEVELPDFIGKTTWPNKNVKPTFTPETNIQIENNKITGLSVIWEDGPNCVKGQEVSQQFQATTDANGKLKVSVIGLDEEHKPKPGTYTFRATYNSISWALTFHVYDVKPDGTFHYSPLSTKEHVLVGMVEDDEGEPEMRDWLFRNDDYRVELNQNAVNKTMGTCADLVAIGFSDEPVDDISHIQFNDLNLASETIRYTPTDGAGVALEINVSKSREEHTNREEDHVQFTSVSYTPVRGSSIFRTPVYVYYKYVILSEAAIHSKDDSQNQSSGSQSGSGTQTGSSGTSNSRLVNSVSDATRGVEMYTYFILQPIVAELTGATMSVGDTIDLNFYMDEDQTETHPIEQYAMDFVLDGVVSDGLGTVGGFQRFQSGSNLWQDRRDDVLGQDVRMYGFTFRDLNAYQMGETVTARLWLNNSAKDTESAAEGEMILVDERTFSVKQYAYAMLKQKDAANQPLREMLVDMLNYGTEALQYAVSNHWVVDPGLTVTPPVQDADGTTQGTDTGDSTSETGAGDITSGTDEEETPPAAPGSVLPNSILNETLAKRYLNYIIPDSEKVIVTKDNSDVTNAAVGMTMLEGMQMSLRFQFRLKSDWSAYKAMLTYPDGHTAEITSVAEDSFVLSGERLLTIYVNGISPFYWTYGETPGDGDTRGDGRFTLTIKDGDTAIYQIKYGVGTYCFRMKEDTAMKPLVEAMYKYGTTAKAWLDTNPEHKDEIYGTPSTEPTTQPTEAPETAESVSNTNPTGGET